VNTEGAEILYQLAVDKVREVSENPEKTLLFDVCCGTGTIGLTCMKEGAVGQVIGVDISEPAIEDAKKNAVLNGYGTSSDDSDSHSQTRFVAARAEQVLGREIQKAKQLDMKFVAVVDPAREGLHADVVKALRSNEEIGRLVYISCNPTATLPRDAALLCAPPTKRYGGRPFRIVSATPVDMFPLTNHCEMIMTFDRLSDAEMKGAVAKEEDKSDEIVL
jgi:tRNA (uracil-5-)-methyltransferase